MITKIISGGQTGADQGALAAAKELGISTGGTAPKGYRTESGPNMDLCLIYGLNANSSTNYNTRTSANVIASDGTLLFGKGNSAGTKLTLDLCFKHKIPYLYIYWKPGVIVTNRAKDLMNWLNDNNIKILNVAGNRESVNPGIFQATKDFLIGALR